ncbi:MAG: domain S-box/diguanylate cyclase protein [Chthonomonadales bacterium]|nr:domain S-box/diguanylate cyclase protein [Chthonomonadales bacterium]
MDPLLDTAPCGFLSFSDDGIILAVNATLREWLGYPSDAVQGQSIETLLPVASRIFYQTHFFPLLKISGKVEEVYFSIRTADGDELPVLVNAVRRERNGISLNDCVLMVVRQRNRFEDEILHAKQALNEHKVHIETLNQHLQQAMTETHHRVKNSLQVISALVDMQIGIGSETVPISELVRLSQHIRALAAIHDILTHQTKDGGEAEKISVQMTLENLLPLLQGMMAGRDLTFQVEDVAVPLRQATSLAILTNELVSNAIKHGKGDIGIVFTLQENQGRFEVWDEGDGFPADFDPLLSANTGVELVETISRFDLQGKIAYENRDQGGARIVVVFPLQHPDTP